MQYDALSRSTVKITLSEEDMREYSLCAENIALKTAESKRSLARLLKRMKLFSGYKTERLFLEAFPRAQGGCILYVSSLGEEPDGAPPKENRENTPLLCTVEGLDCFIRLCTGIYRYCDAENSCAYAENGRYSLLLLAPPSQTSAAKRLMGEYGTVCSDIYGISSVSEHGKLICGSDAAKIFAKLG